MWAIALVRVAAVGLTVPVHTGATWSYCTGSSSSPSEATSDGVAGQATLPSSVSYGWLVEVCLRSPLSPSPMDQDPPSPSRHNLLAAAAFSEVSVDPSPMLEDEVCLPPEEEDECLAPEVLLHIAYEVVSQLEKVEEFRQLSLEELSLRDFLVEQIHTLQPVVEAQEDLVPPLAHDIVDLAQDPWSSQPDVVSVDHYLGASARVDD
jgi:hypothetical protein